MIDQELRDTAGALGWDIEKLRRMAKLIRRDVLIQVTNAQSGHPGGPLSAADYLTALWFRYLRVDPKNPKWEERDRFVMSNGHCSALNYALLARRGFFDPAYLLTFRTTKSRLQGHPNALKLPGLEVNTGSLGQGLSVAHGIALGLKLLGSSARVFCNCGDGELQEGNIWEAVMAAGHYKTDNLVVTVDWNDAQIDGKMHQVMNVNPIDDKFEAFGWYVIVADGHDFNDILRAYDEAIDHKGDPVCILFKTTMMYPLPSFMDWEGKRNNWKWHGKPLSYEQCDQALKELYADGEPDYEGKIFTSFEEARRSYGVKNYLEAWLSYGDPLEGEAKEFIEKYYIVREDTDEKTRYKLEYV